MALQSHIRVVSPLAGDAAGAVHRLAFASTDRHHVDEHFGRCTTFAVHAVSVRHREFLEAFRFTQPVSQGHDPHKIAARVTALAGCTAVYAAAIGASAIMQLKESGVQPVRVPEGVAICDLLDAFQHHLRTGRLDLLRVQREPERDAGRFAAMEAEGWQE